MADAAAGKGLIDWPVSSRTTRRWLAWGVFTLAAAAFLSAIHNEFINWDDEENFVANTRYCGLRWENFAWFFTTTHMGHYQPLNWLSFAVDYTIGGVDPARFHQTQAILHGMVAVCVMFLTHRILALTSPETHPITLSLGGVAAALFFALHPLRVESVVWPSARTDVLAALFLVPAVTLYLRAHGGQGESGPVDPRRRWAVLGLFLLALLCKEMAVTLPAVLLVLDIYPLRRMPPSPRTWLARPYRRVWLEKIPLFLIAAVAAANAFLAAGHLNVATLEAHSWTKRLAQLPVALVYYPFKTLLPFNLSPLNEFPLRFGLVHPLAVKSAVALAVLVAAVLLLRKRAPGLAAAAVCYLLLIAPVCGLTQRGPQITADRYSYLACLPWAILIGSGFRQWFARRRWTATLCASTILACLVALTQRQIGHWQNSVALWEHAVSIDGTSGGAHANLGHAYEWTGRSEDAVREYRLGLALGWDHPSVHRNLAALYNRLYRNEDAVEQYLADLAKYPNQLESHYYLGVTYERMGEAQKASDCYRRALEINPDYQNAHVALARLFLAHGFVKEAEPRLRRALELGPRHVEALELLAAVCAGTGRPQEALDLQDRCIENARRGHASHYVIERLRSNRAQYAIDAATTQRSSP